MQGLKTLVIVLGVLIVVGMALLGYGFYTKFAGRSAATDDEGRKTSRQEKPAATIRGAFGDVQLELPVGCSIVEMRPATDRLYVRTGPQGACERIIVLDPASGRTLGTLLIRP